MAKYFRNCIAVPLLMGLLATSGCVGLAPRSAEENWGTFYTFLLIDVAIVGVVISVVIFFALRARRQDARTASAPRAGAGEATAAGGRTCPQCGAANARGRRFCRDCGFQL